MNLRATVGTLILAGLLAGCGGGSGSGSNLSTHAVTASPLTSNPEPPESAATPSSAACAAVATPHPGVAAQLPPGFLTVAGWIPTEALSQGSAKVVRGVVPGGEKDLVAVRDAAVDRISTAGYRKTDSDQEPGYEAEADFTGPYEGHINVRPGCRGYLVLTYTINQ